MGTEGNQNDPVMSPSYVLITYYVLGLGCSRITSSQALGVYAALITKTRKLMLSVAGLPKDKEQVIERLFVWDIPT